ncbi:tyrosine-type recombinase/integrase [Variovorax paradoxus]|uniref:tyrosine-type recombinase/integrase n=1 Tax=Variovorax paradoxus TaxID=34073 RepID=UPI0009B93138|nr:tyrosine-type recombinase/integrase [Variovorax paradoxus]
MPRTSRRAGSPACACLSCRANAFCRNRGGAAGLPSDYLFITKQGKPYGKEAFKTLWGAVRKKLGLKPREITFHDMRAKAASDSDSDVSAQKLLHHEDVKVTKHVYRRRVPTGTPLPSAIAGAETAEMGRVCQESTSLSKPKKNGSELLALTR